MVCLIFAMSMFLVAPVSAANTQNFYFDDFTADYYLSKDAEGISHLKVVENLTAVFPDYEQNKGIYRQIPYTNQGGANVTLPSLNSGNITVLRNGESEPIYDIEIDNGYYVVSTGDESYVMGKQVYTLKYEFEKVVTEFPDYQELYWDTNGSGWAQRFNKVTARVHFDEDTKDAYTGKSWCYVGKHGEKGEGRCKITETSDGVEFTANSLTSYENLTFDVELKPGSFVVPEPEENYAYVWLLVGLAVICVISLYFPIKNFLATRGKARYYKGLFVKPEYQPDKKYSLPEMAEIYVGKKKDMKVAMLLDLVVQKKVTLIKGENGDWKLKVEKLDGVRDESVLLLKILNGGSEVGVGDEIEIKRRTATSALVSLDKKMKEDVVGDLKRDKLVEEKYRFVGAGEVGGVGTIIFSVLAYTFFMCCFGLTVLGMMANWLGLNGFHGLMVFEQGFLPTAAVIILVTVAIWVILGAQTKKFKLRTEAGLRASRYMEGLKLYISMVEADRLKFLQSVKGADVSANGIVKLYEKLLPYAAVFGLEESWMKEMEQYCKMQEIEEPDYLLAGFTAYELTHTMRNAAGYAAASTVIASSSSSGGGGGGFSGGGGGGGGGGGR